MRILIVQRQSIVAGAEFSLSVYARIIEAMDWLRNEGKIEYTVCAEKAPYMFRVLKWADAVIFCKHFSPKAQELAEEAKKQHCVTLLDIDDWIFTFPDYSGGATKDESRFKNICAMLDMVDHVTVANELLRTKVAKYRPDVTFVPNGIYVERYPSPCMKESQPPRIVFSNADFLKMCTFKHDFLEVLKDFTKAHPEIIFDFYGDIFPEIHELEFLHYTYRLPYNDYIHCLAKGGYTFGVTPLGGDEDPEAYFFNCCKNPFKYLNYGVAGIPCIFSNVKIYQDCVKQNVTGILTDNTYDAWLQAFYDILKNKMLRDTIRYQAYEDIRMNYHIKKSAEIYFHLLSASFA